MMYALRALLERFDTRLEGETALTGRISSLIGEALLLDGLAHAYTAQGHDVDALAERPHRDGAAFQLADAEDPGHRDLDAWLVLRGTSADKPRLVAVECKTWTSSSIDGSTIADGDIEALAKLEWSYLSSRHFESDRWTAVNKVALPLRVPAGFEEAEIERVLAVWRPISSDGQSPWSLTTVETLVNKEWKPVDVHVFSMSLYVRDLLRQNVDWIQSIVAGKDIEATLSALRSICSSEGAR